jgi:hypothetical protein
MALKDFTIRREEMRFQGGVVLMRGLALNDITHLLREHLAELNTLFKLYEKEDTRDTAIAQSINFATTIVMKTPELAATAITLACDEIDSPEALDVARKLPFPTQVEMIRKIIELTFEEAGGLKKFIDSLVGTIQTLRPASLTEG